MTGAPAPPPLPPVTTIDEYGRAEFILGKYCGLGLTLVVNVTVLVTDISEFAVVNEAFGEMFPVEPPARMVMQVPLPLGLLISVGCVAIVESA